MTEMSERDRLNLHILHAGVRNSGNLLLHGILNDCLQRAGLPSRQFITTHPVARVLA